MGDYDSFADAQLAKIDPEDDKQADAETLFEFEVAKQVRTLEVRREAQRRIALKGRDTAPWDVGTLGEVLTRPAPPVARIAGLIPSDAGTLLVAQRKVGKTTWLLNLARALVTGGSLLGRFEVQPISGTVAYLNFEVSGWTLARWADEAGVPRDRLIMVGLRGARNPLSDPQDRGELAEELRSRNVESLIVDPFGRAFDGANQNDTSEVAPWLNRLDQWARSEVGARDVILAAHAGWNGERTRGSSALEDWADSIVTLTQDADGQRFMRAIGRDVDLDEDRLDFDPSTRALTLSGEGGRQVSRQAERSADLRAAVSKALADHPGLNGVQLENQLRTDGAHFQKGAGISAAADLVGEGRAHFEEGPHGSKRYFLEDVPRGTPRYPNGAGSQWYPGTPDLYRSGVPGYHEDWLLRAGTDICRECGNHLDTEPGMKAKCRDRHQVRKAS